MKLDDLKLLNDNETNIDEYLSFYKYIRDNMEHPEWLAPMDKDEVTEILGIGGKLWIYKNTEDIVCSVFYIPATKKSLMKHKLDYPNEEVASCGPIMVNKKYVGNNLAKQMLDVLDEYSKSIGKKYIFTKIHPDNIYSKNSFIKSGYTLIDTYESSSGPREFYFKKY